MLVGVLNWCVDVHSTSASSSSSEDNRLTDVSVCLSVHEWILQHRSQKQNEHPAWMLREMIIASNNYWTWPSTGQHWSPALLLLLICLLSGCFFISIHYYSPCCVYLWANGLLQVQSVLSVRDCRRRRWEVHRHKHSLTLRFMPNNHHRSTHTQICLQREKCKKRRWMREGDNDWFCKRFDLMSERARKLIVTCWRSKQQMWKVICGINGAPCSGCRQRMQRSG